jgi:hypothetical protein
MGLKRSCFKPQEVATLLTIPWEPLSASEAEQATFQEEFPSMSNGWSSVLYRWEDNLKLH